MARVETSTSPSVVVIGAGIAGLATAALLTRRGLRVTLVEQLDAVGGRAGTLTTPLPASEPQPAQGPSAFTFDTGPSWYLMPEAYDRFFALCGTSTAQQLNLHKLEPAYRVFNEHAQAYDISTGVDHVASLFEQLEPGSGPKLRKYLAHASAVYALALQKFLYTTFDNPTEFLHLSIARQLPTLARLLTSSLQQHVNARFRHPVLRQILSYPAVFLSTQPAQAPALYSLMSHTDLVEGVYYPAGGFGHVVQALAQLASTATILTETTVHEILTQGSRATGVRVSTPTGTRTIPADAVVSCADYIHTETALLPPQLRSISSRRISAHNPGLGTVLVMLGVRGELPELAHHSLLFSTDWAPDFAAVYGDAPASRPLGASESIYVSRTSATDPSVAPEGYESLFMLIPVPADTTVGHGSAYVDQSEQVQTIADAAINQLARWAQIPDLQERIVVKETIGPADFEQRYNAWSAGSVGPAHTLAQSAFFRGSQRSKKVDNLFYAGGTTLPGVGVPMCLISAENAANLVEKTLGSTHE